MPKQKFITRIGQDPSINRKVAIQLPRMGFEMTAITYDPTRKINTMGQRVHKSYVNGAPSIKKMFNPDDKPFDSLFNYWETLPDEKGATVSSELFSDEGLIAQLTKANKPSFIQHIQRGISPSKDWIDRSNWKLDLNKLKKGQYVTCNFMRPFESYFPAFKDVIDFIIGEENI